MIPTDGTYYIHVEDMTGAVLGNMNSLVLILDANAPAVVDTRHPTVPAGQVTLLGGAGNDTLNG